MPAKTKAPRKSAKTSSKTETPRGNMKPAEIRPLVNAALKAFARQSEAGLDDGQDFDSWRHKQCLDAVGKPGLTACNHEDYRPLLAHFQTLAGDAAAAFSSLMKTGAPSDHAAPGDTFEARRTIAHTIAEVLETHVNLASASIDSLIAADKFNWKDANPGIDYPGPDPAWLADLEARKAALDAKGKGPVNVGYLVWIVRQKTRRPDLQLGKDWQVGLAERCTARQLAEIRSTIVNRINAAEGVGSTGTRNKTQRSPKAKAARSPHIVAPRPGTDPF